MDFGCSNWKFLWNLFKNSSWLRKKKYQVVVEPWKNTPSDKCEHSCHLSRIKQGTLWEGQLPNRQYFCLRFANMAQFERFWKYLTGFLLKMLVNKRKVHQKSHRNLLKPVGCIYLVLCVTLERYDKFCNVKLFFGNLKFWGNVFIQNNKHVFNNFNLKNVHDFFLSKTQTKYETR